MLIKEIKKCADGTEISSYLSLKSRTALRSYSHGYMFNAVLSDKTGDINFVYFGGSDREKIKELYTSFRIGDIVFSNGTLETYAKTGKKQINVGSTRGEIRYAKEDEYDVAKFIVETNQSIDEMFTYIVGLIDSIEEPHLKELLKKFIDDKVFVEKFKTFPGARVYHHSCKGGLLEHVWEMVQYCEKAVEIHPSLNRDLIISGGILHDIGKIKENKVSPSIKETREGMLLGHIFLGAEMVKEKISKISNFPPLIENKLLHILLSHHEKKEYGSMIEPKTPEAITVACADAIGSKITQYIRAKKDSETTDFQNFRKPIGWVFIE